MNSPNQKRETEDVADLSRERARLRIAGEDPAP
jgi:hypothetical protein